LKQTSGKLMEANSLPTFGETGIGFYLPHELLGDRWAALGMLDDALECYRNALRLRPDADWIACKILRLETASTSSEDAWCPPALAIFLFMPFYTPKDPDRRAEIEACLQNNLHNPLIARIVLLVDDGSIPTHDDARLEIVQLDRRPTYLDWVRESLRLCPGRISVLANSDIYFDDSLALIGQIFKANRKAFIALSRFEKAGDALTPHPNPQWSQDTWAFIPQMDDQASFDPYLRIPLGVPRCDNKVAYAFSLLGYEVFNPFPSVRSVHVHETGRRYYDKTGDRTVLGTVAYVHPGSNLLEPAKLKLDIWSMRSSQYANVGVNRSIEGWDADSGRSGAPRQSIIAHDADWQFPAVTEQHALRMMRRALSTSAGPSDVVYLGFPFATLIDLANCRGMDNPETIALLTELNALRTAVSGYGRVISVCQHIHARRHEGLFESAGVTDLFWSHKIVGEDRFGANKGVALHPFPLYPVQQVRHGRTDQARRRKWLFSFVGSKPAANYLTQVRSWIIEHLSGHPDGLIIDRDEWHYNKLVYDLQIRQRTTAKTEDFTNQEHEQVFREVLDESVFTLCPSGSGPNSIRLWEAIVNGSIPVVLSDTWQPPGPAELWDAAILRIPEERAAVQAIPRITAGIVADPKRLSAMRQAVAKLCALYGPGRFVTDIVALFPVSARNREPEMW